MSIVELVRNIIACLIEDPAEIKIEESSGQRTIVITITVPKDEIGKIIGKKGKIASAIRTICENIAAKDNKRVNIHIID